MSSPYLATLEKLKLSALDSEQLTKFLGLIHAPTDCTGLSVAIPNLLRAAKAISRLSPFPGEPINLLSALEVANQNINLLPRHSIGSDRNPLFGHYDVYPLYSLFTQTRTINEQEDSTGRFDLLVGLLLRSILLSDTTWHPIPHGYAEFVSNLRKVRRYGKWADIAAINTEAASLESFVTELDRRHNNIIAKAHNIANQILLVGKPATRITNTPSSPYLHKLTHPTHTQEANLGETDEWKVGSKIRVRHGITTRPASLPFKEIILQKPPRNQTGVDLCESEVAAFIAQAPTTPNTGELPNSALQKLQILDARFASEFDNQFLPNAWNELNAHEVNSLISAIKDVVNNASEARQARIGALIAGLSILTSRSPEALSAFRLMRATEDQLNEPAIFLDKCCWFSPFPELDRFKPTEEQSVWLSCIGEGCYLPLPIELLSAISDLSAADRTLGEALGCSSDRLFEFANDFCRKVRQDARSRANVSWLRSVMFHRMLALSSDEIGCIATLGNAEHAPNVGLYYATFDQSKWRDIYSRATSSLALTPSIMGEMDSLPYGSRQLPIESELRNWISSLAQSALEQCKQAKSDEEVIAGHNQFSCYTFLMLVAATAHRPAKNPTFSPLTIDLKNGWAIISDKITNPSTRVRLIPLPEIVIQQLKNYQIHLRNLSNRVHHNNPELAAKISMLIEPPVHELMPYFFWLEENLNISPMHIQSVKERLSWPYEGNAFRHFMATGLRKKSTPAEYIAILLAHVGTGQYGFGKFSSLSPSCWKEQMIPALEHELASQGWQNITGLTHLRKSQPDHNRKRNELAALPENDVFAKARIHVDTIKQDRLVVRAAFNAAKNNTPPESPRDEFLEAFRAAIMALSTDAPDRLALRLNLHVRYVRLHRNALNPSSIPGWAADMQVEDTQLIPETLKLAACIEQFRGAIPTIAQHFNEMNTHERIALIMVSSVIFGGLLQKSLVGQIPKQIFTGIRWFEQHLWIDFEDPQSGGCQRWLPDPVTSLLIARCVTATNSDLLVHNNHLQSSLTKLLNKMGQATSPAITFKSLDQLIKAAGAYFTMHLPSLLGAFARGDVRSASLKEGAWLRLLSGRPLQPEATTNTPRERKNIRPHSAASLDEKVALKIYSDICEIIRAEFPAASSGASNRKGARKNHLKALSENLKELSDKNTGMPSIVFAIQAWANHLAVEGSVIVSHPALGTIYNYITDISSPLIEFCAASDFIELDEAALTDVYQRVIYCGSKKRRSSRAKSLRWFHEFCEEEFDLTDIDWNEIAPGLTHDKSNVSANLITHTEYTHAKKLIRTHPSLAKRERQMHEVALILLYRCGLRLGELLRLTISDAVLHIQNVLLIRNGIYGKTKTRAGIRQIPWLDRLDDEELATLSDWINHRKIVVKGDPWGALFGEAEEARTLEVRLHLSRLITHVLRIVSGDPTVRIHHMRHGAGTNALSIALSTENPDKMAINAASWFNCRESDIAEEFRTFHLGQSSPTRRIVYAISQTLGHSSPRTTCWHYGHSLDTALHAHVTGLITLKNVEVSLLSGMNINLLNVTSFNNKAEPTSVALNWLLKDTQCLVPHIQLADTPFVMDNWPSPAPIQCISSPKLAHVILADIANGFSVAQIANRYAKEEIEITTLDFVAQKIERKTSYPIYKLNHRSTTHTRQSISREDAVKIDKLLTGHAVKLIPKFKEVLSNRKFEEQINDGIAVWLESYKPNQSGLNMPYAENIKSMFDLLNLLDIKNEQIGLASNSTEEIIVLTKEMKLKIPSTSLIVRSKYKRSIKFREYGISPAATLHVTSSSQIPAIAHHPKGGASIAMQKLHHLFFLAAVLLSSRKTLEGNQSNGLSI